MKPTLLFAALSMVFASPSLCAKSELEILRSKCAEQERQIQQLEQDNAKLRSNTATPRQTAASQNEAKPAQPSRPEDAANPGVTSGSTNYTVKSGDSMEKIADKLGTSSETLAKANGLKTTAALHPGQKLKVPNAAAIASIKEGPAPAKTAEEAATPSGKTYTIRDNDTFSSIARKQKISVEALIAANPKVKPTTLHTGQVMNLTKAATAPEVTAKTAASESTKPAAAAKSPAPSASTPVLASKAPAAEKSHLPTQTVSAPATKNSDPKHSAAPAAPAPEKSESTPTPPAPTSDKKIHSVTIDGEMTYEEFAAKHGTNPERLNALNGLDLSKATVLAKGSELYVPAQP